MLNSPGLQFGKQCLREPMDWIWELQGALLLCANCVFGALVQVEANVIKGQWYKKSQCLFHEKKQLADTG